jgi:hypothetical protein
MTRYLSALPVLALLFEQRYTEPLDEANIQGKIRSKSSDKSRRGFNESSKAHCGYSRAQGSGSFEQRYTKSTDEANVQR